MRFKIPQPLKLEREELHRELVKATQAGGKVGEAAKTVAKILHPHFEKGEEYALPPLGLLFSLAKGNLRPEMGNVVSMSDRLRAGFLGCLESIRKLLML